MDMDKYLHTVYKNYEKILNDVFLDRYLPFEKLESFLINDIFPHFENSVIGYSEQQKPIYSIDVGQGSLKILIWSQMHGNESTTTKSILDLLNWFRRYESDEILTKILEVCHIKFIPMLNPDGASLYTRFNSNQIDLNRDAVQQSQAETKAFFNCLDAYKPNFCFNMHGQRTIFSAGEDEFPATLSFLAPSCDEALNINNTREKAMQLIANASKSLEAFLPNQVGRYDDAYNPNCFGDYIQGLDIPTILFEFGHYPEDYCRNETRKFGTLSLLKMFHEISNSMDIKFNTDSYFKIPMNAQKYLDIIITDINNLDYQSVGIHYQEVLKDERVVFEPYLKQLINLKFAHKIIKANGKNLYINGKQNLKIDTLVKELKIGTQIIDISIDECN
jgi:hypothetical protein